MGVTLGVEELQRVNVAFADSKGGRCLVHVERVRGRSMNTADIDRELAIDENPQIVVARECKHLAARILEFGVKLRREVEISQFAIVVRSRVSPTAAIQREEAAAREGR